MKKIIAVVVVLVLGLGAWWWLVGEKVDYRELGEYVEHPLIRVTTPLPGSVISNPLVIEGEAKGNWFFEASAPVTLTDWDGRIIKEWYITAEGEWMTTDFVPFSGTLEFEEPEDIGDFSDWGHLILHKNNPSDMRELDDALEFRIRFR